jgi:hypothetical protein
MGERKEVEIGKEEVKLPLFADNMILYLKYSENSSKKTTYQKNTIKKVARYKINIQNSVGFLY